MSGLTPEQAACRQRTDEEQAVLRSSLRVSRDCTVDDLALIMPGASEAERAAFLAGHRGRGDVVTFVVPVLDGEPVPGMIIGPPGSERYLRRPGEDRRPGGGA